MDIVLPIITLILGLLVGVSVGYLLARSKAAEQAAALERELAVAQERAGRLEQAEQALEGQRGRVSELEKELAGLQAQLHEERKTADEKLKLLEGAREELKTQFEALAGKIFDAKGEQFSHQSKERLDAILQPFNQQLGEFKKKVEDIHLKNSQEQASLKTQLDNLKTLNEQLNQEAINLTRALKGDKKQQGNWGELILERVLEQSGLRKGHEYETQKGYRDSEGTRFNPDVVVRLPDGKDIIIDSKVSLLAYERFASAEAEADKLVALGEHVQAIRDHIDGLSGKDYSDLQGLRSLDYILMFMPIEPAFIAAVQHDPGLYTEAFNKKIVVVTPTTLLVTLKTIESIWRYERQNRNTLAIADKASKVYDKLRGFVEDVERLGNQLDTARGTYDKAMDKLTRGRGNLVSQAQQFVDLGVKVKKEIPASVLEATDLDPVALGDTADPDTNTDTP